MRIGRIFNSYGPRLRAEGFYGRVVSRFLLQALKGEDLTVFGCGVGRGSGGQAGMGFFNERVGRVLFHAGWGWRVLEAPGGLEKNA